MWDMVSGFAWHTLHLSSTVFFKICLSCHLVKRASSCAARINDSDCGDRWAFSNHDRLSFFEMEGFSSSLKNIPCCDLPRQVSYRCFWIDSLAFSAMTCACLRSGLASKFFGRSSVRFSENFSARFEIENRHDLSNSKHFCSFVLVFGHEVCQSYVRSFERIPH